ncbi:Kelch repeat-containing protein [Gimesia maris]|uniref:Kelch repeat-containing protein n=1 Tax=Gimesia maris TaxID=122 RepID=UPI00241EA9AE|nr:GDSL-type esterase/lipase family protein [Gimesia maris]|tara:strand:+ start:169007 stop:171193 length:2187 start_codon:yes stop_codon:yes gene_type:complete
MIRPTCLFLFLLLLLTNISFADEPNLDWVQVTEKAGWQPRDSQGELVYKDQLWIFGGWFNSYEAPPRDVWNSADGKNWKLVTKEAPWIHSDLPMTVVFKDKMWLMGGWYNGRLKGHSAGNQVWSTVDGKNWELVTPHADWTPRLAAGLVVFKDRLWLLGGTENYYFGDEKSLKNDVWSSADGKTWKQETTDAGWSPRAYHQAAVLNGKMYVFGGGNYTPEYHATNDVWSSEDGVHWKQETAQAPWHERLWFSTVVYRDRLWVIGGWSNNPAANKNDAWYSQDGKDWKQLKSDHVWKARHEHSAFVFQDKIWLAGGHAQPLNSEVWTLDIPEAWFEKTEEPQKTTSTQSAFPRTIANLKTGKPAKIVCFGDSVTGVYYHTGSRRAYTDMLGIALEKNFPEAKLKMINAGISGHTTVNALSRIERDVLKQQPDLVTVMFGLNDMTRVPLEEYRENLKLIVKQCRDAGAEVLLCTPNSVISTSGRPAEKLVQYCDVVREVCDELQVPLCDNYQKLNALREQDALSWRLMMSDEIHPNMAGHKKLAELMAESISGEPVSLADVAPLAQALPRVKSLVEAKKTVKVIAMPPLDQLIQAAFKKVAPDVKLEVSTWQTAGKSRRQIEADAKALVRPSKPDLVLLTIPPTAKAGNQEELIHSLMWTMNYSLNFGAGGWDCVVFHPDVFDAGHIDTETDRMTRKLVRGQDLTLVERTEGQTGSPEEIVIQWLKSQLD